MTASFARRYCAFAAAVLSLCLRAACAPAAVATSDTIADYLRPFVATNNFSGSVLVVRDGKTVFDGSYGFANPARRIRNTHDTRFHIASNSMLFTAFAIMRLVERHQLSLDERAGQAVSDIPNAQRITIRELLEERSGLPDANDLPAYDTLLASHQTPSSLVARIRGLKPLAEPGQSGVDEEHSAYNVLALIIERKTGLPFARAMRSLVFAPAGMANSGADDDAPAPLNAAIGLNVFGEFGLRPAPAIHWSALPGNGSDFSSTRDVNTWFDAFLDDKLLNAASRATMLATTTDKGYGWDDKGLSTAGFAKRFNGIMYFSGGRAPGFSSTIIYLPAYKLRVIMLSNIEHDMSAILAENVAAIAAGLPYKPFAERPVSLSATARAHVTGNYKFGSDFYRRNAILGIRDTARGLVLDWPQRINPLLPVAANVFFDRYYWLRCTVAETATNRPESLTCGKFVGRFVLR